MMLRGFSQKHMGRRTITKILTSTISPLLTYALEAFPLNNSDYVLIDEVLEEIISKTTSYHSEHTTWNFYEQHITPPSEIIRRNKISLHIKAKNSKTGLLKELYQTLPNNFLANEVNMIESTWGFESNQIIQQYKGEKIVPKQTIASLLDDRIDNHLESILNESNWNVYKEKQHPAALPLNLNNPTPDLLNLRSKLIFDTHATKCSLCEMQTNNAAAHQLLQCQHTWKLILREKIWEKIRQYDPNLLKFIQEAPTMVAARVMTGLQSTSSSHAMNYLLTEVQKDICQIYEDAGLGTSTRRESESRAERAPYGC